MSKVPKIDYRVNKGCFILTDNGTARSSFHVFLLKNMRRTNQFAYFFYLFYLFTFILSGVPFLRELLYLSHVSQRVMYVRARARVPCSCTVNLEGLGELAVTTAVRNQRTLPPPAGGRSTDENPSAVQHEHLE